MTTTEQNKALDAAYEIESESYYLTFNEDYAPTPDEFALHFDVKRLRDVKETYEGLEDVSIEDIGEWFNDSYWEEHNEDVITPFIESIYQSSVMAFNQQLDKLNEALKPELIYTHNSMGGYDIHISFKGGV